MGITVSHQPNAIGYGQIAFKYGSQAEEARQAEIIRAEMARQSQLGLAYQQLNLQQNAQNQSASQFEAQRQLQREQAVADREASTEQREAQEEQEKARLQQEREMAQIAVVEAKKQRDAAIEEERQKRKAEVAKARKEQIEILNSRYDAQQEEAKQAQSKIKQRAQENPFKPWDANYEIWEQKRAKERGDIYQLPEQYTPEQEKKREAIMAQMMKLQSADGLSPAEIQAGVTKLSQELESIGPPKTKAPFPPEQGPGQVWPDPLTGSILTRDENGLPKVLVQWKDTPEGMQAASDAKLREAHARAQAKDAADQAKRAEEQAKRVEQMHLDAWKQAENEQSQPDALTGKTPPVNTDAIRQRALQIYNARVQYLRDQGLWSDPSKQVRVLPSSQVQGLIGNEYDRGVSQGRGMSAVDRQGMNFVETVPSVTEVGPQPKGVTGFMQPAPGSAVGSPGAATRAVFNVEAVTMQFEQAKKMMRDAEAKGDKAAYHAARNMIEDLTAEIDYFIQNSGGDE